MIKYIFTIVLLCAFCQQSLFAQGFNSVTTPDGTNLVAVGNSGRLYRSASGGSTWSNVSFGGINMNCVTSFGNDVWIAANNGTVYKTLKTNAPLTTYTVGSSTNLNSIDFIDANTGFACGDGGAVYKSIDGGANWSLSNSGIASEKLNSIVFADASNGTVVGNNGAIYVTNNGGSSWSAQSSGVTFNLLKVKYFGSGLAAVGEFGTLLINSGTWTSVATRTKNDIRGVAGTGMSDIHVVGGGGFIRNNKSGNTLFGNFEQNPMMANLVDIFSYDANKYWAVSSLNSVIIYTNDGGNTWSMPDGATISYNWVTKTPSGSGIGNNLCKHPTDRNSMFVVYGNKVYVSRDRSETWTQIATISVGSRAHSFYVSPVDTNIWLAAMESSPDCVVRSTNYGANWSNILAYDFSTYGQPLEMDQNNPSTFYYAPSSGAGIGMFKSTDNGATFNLIAPYNNASINQPCDIVVMWDSSAVMYLGDDGADIFKTTNGGLNWTLVKPSSSSEIPSMCNSVFDKSICYATTWGSSEVYKTQNHGSNWSIVSNNSGSGWGSDLCHEDPSLVLTGNYGSQAYLTTNGGASFFNVNSGLSGAGAGIIVPERGYMLNMQTGNLFKLNITYNYSPVFANVDVQALSLGATGTQYFPSATITPTGTVKNNNGVAAASFSVTRKISPGGYTSTKSVVNLAANASTSISFDEWTFNSGSTYTVKDSVYIFEDTNPVNDVLTGTITPNVGTGINNLSQGFSGVFPPAGWSFQFSGTNYWKNNPSVSSYGAGTGSSYYNFWSAGGSTGSQSLISPTFTATSAGDSLGFDHAYSPYSGSQDSLTIEISTNGGTTYSTLVRLRGQTNDTIGHPLSFNTVAQSASQFTPGPTQWRTKKWVLPAGTNRIKLRAVSDFGNDLYVDSIRISGGSLFTQVNIKLAPEGFYNGSTLNMNDTVVAYLRSTVSPFAKVDSSRVVLNNVTLTAPAVFATAPTGTYYIHVKHRNSIETWSKSGGESMTRGVLMNFDFTTAQSQAYGSNMVLISGKYCFFGGDANQNGTVDGSDLLLIDNDAFNFETGYRSTDLNGDGSIDGSDLSICDNNAANFISKSTPESAPKDQTKASIIERNREYYSRDK